MSSSLFSKAKNLLYSEYMNNYQIVKDSPFHRSYVNEKLRHSWQVSGAGNGILRHESFFQNKGGEFLEIVKATILLHDIYRFTEVRLMYESGLKIDHGAQGALFLKNYAEFNKINITLPIKHHGHMIEDFYADLEYKNITDKGLKAEIEHILFAVRDADKIANWQILANELQGMEALWLPYPEDTSEEQGVVSETVLQFLERNEILPRKYITTNAEEIISILCWIFDMNYSYALLYCQRLNLVPKILNILQSMHVKKSIVDLIQNKISQYSWEKFAIKL